MNLHKDREGGFQLCKCGLPKSWHGPLVPRWFNSDQLVPFEKMSRDCDGFSARDDQSFSFNYTGDHDALTQQ